MSNNNDDTTVRVALRIRPASAREQINGCQTCTVVSPGTPQVLIGGSHGFTYDYVFDTDSQQESIFESVQGLVDGCLDGYNATIIAYGQTGSGKTYTMGTGFENLDSPHIMDTQGIIPRAVHYLFNQIEKRRKNAVENKESPPEFHVNAQFVELYNEEIHDLIGEKAARKGSSQIKIHEDSMGNIYMVGVGTQQVQSVQQTMNCLKDGALSRTTAATNMNDQSSRSHAIFTLHIQQRRLDTTIENGVNGQPDFETLSAKFHFVDLAGSERLKRTGAVGDRAKEGISINCGLLALGNVISALGDKSKKSSHVPYRDSKLTRLLQDSLGGNSRTIMIACVSPCDQDFVETLNTLKYANRARNIKNKVTINQDKSSRTIALLRQEISQLQLELLEYKQGKRTVTADGEEMETDAYHENLLLKSQVEVFASRINALQETVTRLTNFNAQLLATKASEAWDNDGGDGNEKSSMASIVEKYILEIEELRAKVIESEATCENLRKKTIQSQTILNQSLSPRPIVSMSSRPGTATLDTFPESDSVSNLLDAAKSDLINQKKQVKRLKHKSKKKRKQDTSHEIEGHEHDSSLENDAYSSLSESEISPESEHTETNSESESECSTGTQKEIASLNDQINFKEQLIAQLEASNRRSIETKQDYERKIEELLNKIRRAEEERDLLLNSKSTRNTNAQQAKAKETSLKDYESKLRKLSEDLKEMQKLAREHDKLLRKNVEAQKQVEKFKAEIELMKRNKVKLMNQLKEDSAKARDAEAKRLREIAQLKKDQRKKDVHIRTLESKGKLNEQLLKRKHEEVNMLRKQSRNNLSRKAAGKVVIKKSSPIKAKNRWGQIHSEMLKHASKRTTLENFENEMMNAISERTKIKEEIQNLNLNREKLYREGGEDKQAEINRIDDDLDSFNANLAYCEQKINDIQSSIMELTASGIKDDDNGPDMKAFVEHLSKEECSYVMQKMYEDSLENLSRATRLAVLEENNIVLAKKCDLLDNLLSHIVSKIADNDQQGISALIKSTFSDLGTPSNLGALAQIKEEPKSSFNGKTNGIKVNGSLEQEFEFQRPLISRPPVSAAMSLRKARGLTSTTQELLGSIPHELSQGGQGTPQPFNRTGSLRVPNTKAIRRNTYTLSAEDPLPRSATDSQNNPTNNPRNANGTTGLKRTNYLTKARPNTTGSAIPTNNNYRSTNKERTDEFNTTFITEPSNVTPPGSPNASRRVRDGSNVFNRLTFTSGNTIELSSHAGLIRNVADKNSSYRNVLQQTHTAEGHSKPVLTIFATNDRLLTGSKDATVKYWDLTCGKEISTFAGYPTSVTGVQYDAANSLIFTTSSCYIKIYDPRSSICIKTLTSSGASLQDAQNIEPTAPIPRTESCINSLVISARSNSFYTSFNDRVRIWDIRSSCSVGLMSGKHISQVMCMALNHSNGTETLVTGSKDHYIKVYDLEKESANNVNTPVKFTLDPPHYDGIEALALSGTTLFSGSRDSCIKKWNLERGELHTSMNNAHGGWITGLCFAPSNVDYVLSASRDGLVKLWTSDNCREIGRVEIHKGGVNCIASNSSLVFTGSSEDSIGIWKVRRFLGESTSGDTSPTSDTS